MSAIALRDLRLAGYYSTSEVVPETLPVDLSTATWRTMLRVPLGRPVAAGDLLEAHAWFKVSNDIRPEAYPVGIGAHLWWYDLDHGGPGVSGPWTRMDADAGSTGMNVYRELHHLVLSWHVAAVVPSDWPAGHRIAVAVRADAHSTAWDRDGDGVADDRITVDRKGRLTVKHYVEETS